MTASVVAEIGIRVNSKEIKKLDRTLDAANDEMVKMEKNSKKVTTANKKQAASFKSLGTAAKVAAAALVAVGVAGFAAFKKFGDEIDKTAKTSAKLGIGISELQGLQFAAEQTGVKVETMNIGLQRMVRRLSEAAQGTGVAKKALEELGLDAAKLNNLTVENQFKAIAEALNNVEKQTDKVRLTFALFDSDGVGLINTMKGGAKAISAYQAEAKALGLTLDKDGAKKIQDTNDSMNRFNISIKAVGQSLAVELAPEIKKISEDFTEFIKTAGGAEAIGRTIADVVVPAVRLLGDAMRFAFEHTVVLANAFKVFVGIKALSVVIDITRGMKAAAQGAKKLASGVSKTGKAVTTFGKVFGVVRIAVVALGTAILAFPLTALALAVGAVVATFLLWDKEITATKGLVEGLDSSVGRFKETLKDLGGAELVKEQELISAAIAAVNSEIIRTTEQLEQARGIGDFFEGVFGESDSEALTQRIADLNAELDALLIKSGLAGKAARTIAPEAPKTKVDVGLGENPALVAAQLAADEAVRVQRLKILRAANDAAIEEMIRFHEEKKAAEEAFNEVGLSLLSETDLLRSEEAEKLVVIQTALDIRAITEQEAADTRVALAEDTAERIKDIERAELEAKLAGLSDGFGAIAALGKTGSKKLAAIGKAAAITQATIDGVGSVSKAFNSPTIPYPLNIAAAASMGVLAAANIAKIAAVPLAKGGVLDSPSIVGSVGGSPALAGEAGPEAVMPLSRDSQGRLGVQGGGVNIDGGINVTINGNASASDVEAGVLAAMQEVAVSEIASAQRPGNLANPYRLESVF